MKQMKTNLTNNLNNLLKALVIELTSEITRSVTEQLRKSYVEDITGIVKECLRNDETYRNAGVGFLTANAICEKYKISRTTVSYKCRVFMVERKRVGRHNLINELQFLKTFDKPGEKPKFLKG